MKQLIITTIAAVVLVGCATTQSPEPPTAKAPDDQEAWLKISIYKAIFAGNIEAVKQHLAAGTDVNAKDKYGETPLHFASIGLNRKEVIEMLIAEGADVNVKTDDGRTPLDLAIRRNRSETADLLRKHGGMTAEEVRSGMTPLLLRLLKVTRKSSNC